MLGLDEAKVCSTPIMAGLHAGHRCLEGLGVLGTEGEVLGIGREFLGI